MRSSAHTPPSTRTSHGTGFALTFAELSSRYAFETSGMDIATTVRVWGPRAVEDGRMAVAEAGAG